MEYKNLSNIINTNNKNDTTNDDNFENIVKPWERSFVPHPM